MRLVMFVVALALMAGVAYWAVALRKPVAPGATTEQVQGSGMGGGGMDPGTTMNNARGAAARIQGEGFKRAADIEDQTAP